MTWVAKSSSDLPEPEAPDPITQEIITGKLLAAVDEMGIVLARTSMSPVIYEVLDFACGLCDTGGDLIAQTNGITLFTGTFSNQVRFICQKFADDMRPGDVFVTNDPFQGGTHSCDFAIVRPVFHDGALIGFAISVAHLIDVGGAVPGSLPSNATDMFQEGLRLSGVRLARDDKLIPDIVTIITENVRIPDMVMGDINAELAAVRICAARVEEACNKYGRELVRGAFAHILSSSEALSREAIRALPDGVYHATDVIDGDGNSEDPIPVQLAITVAGDRMTFDFTGCAAARAGPINCSRGALHSAVKTVFKALVAPQAASNEGWFRPMDIVIPHGTVFSALPPQPTGWYYEGSSQASELVWMALAPLAPERFCAGTYMSLCATYISGRQIDTNDLFVHIEPEHGGWGATRDRDGAGGLIAINDGDTYNYSIELMEAKFPFLMRRYGFNTDDGSGAGRRRGGFGLVREYELLSDDTVLHASYGRTRTTPWGIDGGRPGTTNYIQVQRNGSDDAVRLYRPSNFALRRGDRVAVVTGGGGGWGDPADRRVEEIAADIRDGYITVERAMRDYGVEADRLQAALAALVEDDSGLRRETR